MTDFIVEPIREVPLIAHVDLCVIGGSCTGVFAAIRAARLGLSVAIVEQQTIFGGTATAAQVNEWHSLYDAQKEKQVIGGLTHELIERLERRGLVKRFDIKKGERQFGFNSAEMAAELDVLIREHPHIHPFLFTRCVAAVREGQRIRAAIIEDKSGRRAIRARLFIDASGDGDLLRRGDFSAWQPEHLQPVNYQALVSGWPQYLSLDSRPDTRDVIARHAADFNYPTDNSNPWLFNCPGIEGLLNVFGPRVNGVDASQADQLTTALMEGRRLHRALCEMMERELGATGPRFVVAAWAHSLAVRQTWQASCLHRLTGRELMDGVPFSDSIAHGTYPVDIHHPGGTTLRFLDGRETVIGRDSSVRQGRWRDESATPACYHIPYRSLIPRDSENLLIAGRLLDADREAYGGVRVMVNMNQTGEATGVAAALALKHNVSPAMVSPQELRETLASGGSIMLSLPDEAKPGKNG